MAQVQNNNSRTRSVGETNYQNKMFQGQSFETVEATIEAGAKAYAKLAWGEIENFINELIERHTEFGIDLPDNEELAEILVASKRKTIIASMSKRESMPKAFA
jgi:hypothetical protein